LCSAAVVLWLPLRLLGCPRSERTQRPSRFDRQLEPRRHLSAAAGFARCRTKQQHNELLLSHTSAWHTRQEIAAEANAKAAADKAAAAAGKKVKDESAGIEPPQQALARALAGDTVKAAEDRAAAAKAKKAEEERAKDEMAKKLAEAKAARAAKKAELAAKKGN
jgi:hypothetical protein